jgi:Bacterial phospholipase C, C-terminal domain
MTLQCSRSSVVALREDTPWRTTRCDEHNRPPCLSQADGIARAGSFDRYKSKTIMLVVDPGESESRRWPVERTGGRYDLTVIIEGNRAFATQLAGHVENGEDSISDPLMGGLV